MDGWLKQSTAIDLRIGPFLDETTGKDAETGLTVTQAEIRLSKAGGDFAQKTESTALVHDELGYYICKFDTDDTDTLGMLKLAVHESGALPVWHSWMVLPANVWDSLFGADKLQVHADEITAGLITATALGADCITSAKIADNALANEHFADGALTATEITGAAGCAVSSIGDNVITATSINADAITAAKIAAGAIDNATFAADVGSTAYATNIIALAVRKALDEIKLDHLVAVADNDDPVNDSIVAKMAASDGDWSGFSAATDSLEAIRDKETDIETDTAEIGALGAGLTAITDDTSQIGALGVGLTAITDDTSQIGAAGVGLTEAGGDGDQFTAIPESSSFGIASALTLDFGTLLERLYQMVNNKMIVTEASGDVALRNLADDADVATGNVQDLGATTQRNALTW